MKIYMKVKKDIAYNLVYPWNSYIKEQVREIVSQAHHFMFDTKFYPLFYQEDTHSHFIIDAKGERFFPTPLKYELCFVWEYDDYKNDDEYLDVASAAGVYLDDDEDEVKPSKEYVYLGSYQDGQREPLTLPGLICAPREYGEILADCMFADDFSDDQLRRVFTGQL